MNNDIRAINELKILSVDMINRAKSGSPGICLDMAPVMYILFAKVLNVVPNNPRFINRDRVFLSSAHIAPLYYGMLHMAGFPIKKEDLMNFKRANSITPGLPEYNTTCGVEASTSFAGDGVGIAVGQVLAKRYLNALIRQEDEKAKLLSYNTFCFCSEADLLSGSTYEALSFAITQKLDHLVLLVDYNLMGADGSQEELLKPNIIKEFQNIGCYVDILKDATNIREITKAIIDATKAGKPAILLFKNIIGKESFNAGKNILHSGILSFDDTESIRKKLNSFLAPFEISKDSMIHVQNQMNNRNNKINQRYSEQYMKVKGRMNSNLSEIIDLLEKNVTPISFESANYKINEGYREPLIDTNAKIMNLIASKTPLFIGGSAGLAQSTKTIISNGDYQSPKLPQARNIRFGVRERAMSHILNGLALNGLRVFGSTKLGFMEEALPGIRMSALMNLPVTYIFTHDSLYDSTDGPARIPCEQLTTLRTMPNLTVYRPADIIEIMGSWEQILKNNQPSALIISKNNIPKLPGSLSKEVEKGAYIIKKEQTKLDGIIIASGSEVVSALQIAYDLQANNLDIRVISMPSMELFLQMGEQYEEQLLPKGIKTIALEAGNDLIWNRFVKDNNYIIGINDFAYSGVPIEVLQIMNFDYDSLKLKIESLLN